MSTHKSQVESCIKIFSLLLFSIFEVSIDCELVKTCSISNHGCQIADRIFAPYFESLHQLLTIYNDVVVDGEEYLRFSLLGDIITPIHGIVLSPVKVNRNFPLASSLKNTHFLHRFFVIPDDADLIDDGAIHKSVAIEVFHKL